METTCRQCQTKFDAGVIDPSQPSSGSRVIDMMSTFRCPKCGDLQSPPKDPPDNWSVFGIAPPWATQSQESSPTRGTERALTRNHPARTDELPLGAKVITLLAVAITVGYSLWSTVIAFIGGTIPLTGVEISGDLLSGVLWILFVDPIIYFIGRLLGLVGLAIAKWIFGW